MCFLLVRLNEQFFFTWFILTHWSEKVNCNVCPEGQRFLMKYTLVNHIVSARKCPKIDFENAYRIQGGK